MQHGALKFVGLLAVVVLGAAALAFADEVAKPATCAAEPSHAAERRIASCTALIDAEATAKSARLEALMVRAGLRAQAYAISQDTATLDSVIADYDAALKLDPKLTQAYVNRGNAWRAKGDRPRALADYSAALRLDPSHAIAAERKFLALEIERLGALMPVQPPR